MIETMITERFKQGSEYAGQKMRFATVLFDKPYFWMEDVDGTTYLARVGENGLPDFS